MPIATTILQPETAGRIGIVPGNGSVVVDEAADNGGATLHANYSGTGFLDINGDAIGPRATFEVEVTDLAPFEITLRYANGSSGPRPIALSSDGGAAVALAGAAPATNVLSDTGTGGWSAWATATFTVTPTATGPQGFAIDQTSTGGAPNLDAVAIHDAGALPNFAAPEITSDAAFSVEEGETAVGTVTADDLDGVAVTFAITAGDEDGPFAINPTTGALTLPGDHTVDVAIDYALTVEASDGEATSSQALVVTVTNAVPEPVIDQIVLQAEDGRLGADGESFARTQALAKADAGDGAPFTIAEGSADTDKGPGEPLGGFGLREGYGGTGYLDFAENADESVSWTVADMAAGRYDLHIRYANGGDPRPLDVGVGGGVQHPYEGFAGTGFQNWVVKTLPITLEDGANEITLAIAGATDGPNVDAVALTSVGAAPVFPPANSAPVARAVIAFDAEEGATATRDAAATDVDADALSYALADGADAGFSVDPVTGEARFDAPAFADGGDNAYAATVVASDGELASGTALTATVTEAHVSDAAPTALIVTPLDRQPSENVTGAAVATVIVADADTVYAASDLELTGGDGEFELIDTAAENRFTLQLIDSAALDAEAGAQASLTVRLGALSGSVVPAPVDDAGDDAGPTGPTGPTPAWSFVSVPDMFNADYGDVSGGLDPAIAAVFAEGDVDYADGLIGAPGWQQGDPNSMNVALARVWKTNTEAMVQTAGGAPDLVAIAGDLTYARFSRHYAETQALFGGDTRAETYDNAFGAYNSWHRKLWEEAGVGTVVAAIGDHEIGDNDWNTAERAEGVLPMKEAFGKHMVDPLGIAPTWNGVSSFAPEGDGQYDEGSYLYQNKNVLFLTVDVFKYSSARDLNEGAVEASIEGAHLRWIEDVLDAAEADASVDHVIVQGHVPVLGPVNSIRSSEMTFQGGEGSAFWRALQDHGTDNGGKVRAYLAGEVHATTVIEDDASGIVQISHGATNQAGGAAQLDPYWIAFDVTPTGISGREYTIVNDNRDNTDTVWEAHRAESQAVDTVIGGPVEIGTIEIDVSGGTTSVTTTGNLEAPLRTAGHQTYVGGPGDDYHEGGIPGVGFTEDNVMYGRGGNDTLFGRDDDDRLFGGEGDDVLDGGDDDDVLTGGPGNDTYVFAPGDEDDRITDFTKGEDTILIDVASFADLTIGEDGGDAIILYRGGRIRLEGVAAAKLDPTDFGFDAGDPGGNGGTINPLYVGDLVLSTRFGTPFEEVREVEVGAEVFADRDFMLASFPAELAGGRFIVGYNDDKTVDEGATLISFTALQDSSVYVAFHGTGSRLPTWLDDADWTPVGQDVVLERQGGTSLPPWNLYGRTVSAGDVVTLGGTDDGATGARNGYFVIVDDSQIFTPAGPATLDAPIVLQAEDGLLVDAGDGDEFSVSRALTQTNGEVSGGEANDAWGLRPGYSGEGYVDFGGAGDSLTWTFDSPMAGTFDLHIRYASYLSGDADRTADISVNGGAGARVAFPGASDADSEASFDTWKVLTLPVTLIDGANTLSLSLAGSGPNVDGAIITAQGDAPDFGPSFTTLAGYAVTEGGTVVGTVGAADVDDDQSDGVDTASAVAFAKAGGADADAFAVDAATGALRFVAAADADVPGDADADNAYEVVVSATDAGGNVATQAVTVSVADDPGDDDAAPTALTVAPLDPQPAENVDGAAIATVTVKDVGTVYAASELTLDGAGGRFELIATDTDNVFVLKLVDTASLDAEADAQPTLTVRLGTLSASVTPAPVNDPGDDGAGPTAITLTGLVVAENAAGAVVAAIEVDGGTPSAGEFGVSDEATYRVIDEGGLKLALQPGVSFDFEGAAPPEVTVSLGDLEAAAFAPTVLDVDEAPTLTGRTVPVAQKDGSGAVIASIDVDDPDADAAYTAQSFSVDDPRFEVIERDGFRLALKDGQSLGDGAGVPTVTVTLAGVDLAIVPDVSNSTETLSILFDESTVTSYDARQDRPGSGTGVTVSGGAVDGTGGEITLDGNLWKRAAVQPFTIEEGTVLRVTVDVEAEGEAVGIGFDLDDDAFDGDASVYQVAGPQWVRRFVDVRTPESTSGTGTREFEIDLSAHAGKTVSSLVLVADDDASSNGLGRVTFLNVEIVPAQGDGNADPRVVGGGVADITIDEGSVLEIDLPFADEDGDALTYAFEVSQGGVPVTDFPASIAGGVLSGALGDTAPGIYEITTTATDGKGGRVATDTFLLTVENVNQAPEANPDAEFEPYFGKVGEEIVSISLADFAGAFTDPDGDALELSVTGLPAGLVFDADEGVIYGTPTEAGDGTFTVVATEIGAEGLSTSVEVVLEVDTPAPGDAITIEAEDFTGLGDGSTGFFATGQAGASGDRLIRTNPNTDGAVETVLSQNGVAPGWYTVAIDVYDELDGAAEFTLAVGGVQVSADGATFDDAGAFTNGDGAAGRGNAGQIANRKTISFAQEVYVEEGTVLSLTGSADGELLRTDSVTLTRVGAPDEAPEAVVLTGDPVAENADGATVGTLSSVDPDGDDAAITYSVDDASIFEIAGDELRLKAGESLDFETAASVSIDVTATDADGASITTTLTVDVADVDEAPKLATPGALTDVTTAFATEARADLTVLGAADPEGGPVTYAVRSATADALPAGITVEGGELVVGDDVPAGTYAVEVFASDGTLESDSVPLTVSVGEPAPFETIVVQAEAFTLIADATAATGDDNLVRTETQNWERDGSPLNPEPNETAANPGGPEFDELGLRPNYSGTGYLDINGSDQGAQATFTFDAPAGDYDLHVRHANGSQERPISVEIGGQILQIADTRTDVDTDGDGAADGGTGWYNWAVATLRFSVTGAGPHTVTIRQDDAQGAPNIDAVAVSLPGQPVVFLDDSADADAFPLDLDGPTGTVPAEQTSSLDFIATGRDDDVVRVEISFDAGATRTDVTDELSAEGEFSVDGSALAAGAQIATVIVTDAAGNEASDTFAFTIEASGPGGAEPVTIQAEDGTRVTVTDVGDPGTGPMGRAITQVIGAGETDAFGNDRENAVGDAFVDFGEDAGDRIDVAFDAPAAGTYGFTVSYAMGSDDARVLALRINGVLQENVSFADSGGWDTYADLTVEVELDAGANTVTLEIPTAANGGTGNGPNIDQVTFSPAGGSVDADRFEDVIKVNFEAPASGNGSFDAPAGYQTPAGYESDTGEAYGDRGNGFTYGWVDVDDASGAVTSTPAEQPTGSARYKDAAPQASDLQKTYLHFDYPGAPSGDRERAWEMELVNGTYELSVAIGDTAGRYDSDYVLNVEGEQFGSDWEPVNLAGEKVVSNYDSAQDGEGFRSTVHTGIVQVTDGRLTIDGIDGQNVEIQWLDLQRVPDLTPGDGRTADLDYSKFVAAVAASTEDGQVSIEIDPDTGEVPLGINPTSDIVVGVELQAIDHRGPDVNFTDGVSLVETLTGIEVPITVQVTGGSDGITISPVGDLKEFTSYTLRVEDVLDLGNLFTADAPARQFQDYSTTFVTGEAPEVVAREVAFTDQLVLDGFAEGGVAITSLEIGPQDGRLYASSITGTIQRWDLDADGTLDKAGVQTLALDYFQDAGRSIIGMAFDPEDPNVIWVTDNAPVPTSGKAQGIDDFSGRLSKITLGDGGDFATATAEAYLIGLPRSGGDHVTNSIEFRANPDAGQAGEPDFLLYFMQGSNTAAGERDSAWGFRPERLLNAAALEVDHTRDVSDGPFDVQTEPYRAGVDVPTFRDPDAVFEANGTVDGFYDPFAEDAVLRIFGEGIRNGYDLVWHSNGNLYVPTNGTARGGNTLDDPRTGVDEALGGLEKQYDYLFQVQEGGYYGHPNELLGHYIVNGGAAGVPNGYTGAAGENAANTGTGGNRYDASVLADPEYDAGGAYSLNFNKSPNGAIEYRSDLFGETLQGAVMFVQFSQGDNVRYVTVDPDTGRITGDEVLRRPDGSEIDEWTDPLDIIENPATGQLYMVTLDRGSGESKIVLLNPAPGGAVGDATADEGGDLTLTVVDGSDASNVVFEVTGLDADIETITVAFDGGAPEEVSLDGQGRFARDLQGAAGAVTATLVVQDEVPNTASASITFTPGDASGSVFIDAREFTLLDADGGTVIRKLEDSSTHENPNSGNDVAPKDGLNDGHDGDSYVDPNGGAEPKVSFVFDAAGAGTYAFTFRMAANNDRSVAILTGTQSEAITVNTGDFTTWATYTVQLELEDGPNTIVVAQTSGAGPNVDSVTVTPIDVAADETADEGGDLSVTLADAGDRTATVFDVAGLDDDIETVTVSFDGGLTSQDVTVADGSFAVNTTALSGDVTVTLTVADEVPNAKTVTTTATFTAVVANDGTETVGGLDYTLYEAENAVLGGAVVVPETADDRGAAGTGFVDFDGTADQTITWTILVGEDGTYDADILYALSTGKDARPMTLSVDGSVVETLAFAPNSDANEDSWGPQGFTLDLTAGVHTITVTAPGANGPNVDQLRIRTEPTVAGDPDADIAVRSLDPAFFDDRLHFSWLDEDDAASNTGPRGSKENAFVEISNTGTADLEFFSAAIDGPFELAQPDVFDGLTLAGGQAITVEVLFDRDAYTPGNPQTSSGVFDGSLVLRTNDEEDRVTTVDLSGFWQARDQGGQEPNVNEVWDVLGFGNSVAGLPFAGGGESAVLDFYDLFLPVDETEAMSPYFRIAAGVDEARVTMVAAYNASGSAGIRLHEPGDKGAGFGITGWNGDQSQTLFPLQDGSFATATFDRGTIPDGWDGDDVFGLTMAGLSTDPTLNPSGGGTVSQTELDARYPGYTVTNGTVFDPDGNEVPEGYTVRMFQAVDEDGAAIPNVYLGVMDYTGINYDYNDNMFIVEGVTAVATGGEAAIAGLDDAAADDRLVFTNIGNPANGAQQFRNEATFTIQNTGLGGLDVTGILFGGEDADSFEVVGALPSSIPEGGSAEVTILFTGTDEDPANAADLHEATMTVQTTGGTQTVALSGLAQSQSERGQEPTVAQIVEAFGYGTDVAQRRLNGGGDVETIGDEVLMPYLKRLDDSQPIEVINLAAFLQQGNISRVNIHDLGDDDLTELFAGDDQQGQTILPDGLVPGAGDTGAVGRATIDRDAPFGLKVTVDGRPTFAAWTDPVANKTDPALGVNDEGHYVRFFQAKDGAGNDIPGTFIGIQDYPGGGNFDYNDAMFLVTNVRPHDLTTANDADGNDVNDALEADADDDGLVAFFDDDDGPGAADVQTANTADGTPWAIGGGLTIEAADYDDGGQGVAYNDDPGLDGGTDGGRPGSDVEVTARGDVGWIETGQWLEYTIDVASAGTYDLDLVMATNGGGGRSATVTFTAAGDAAPYASTGQVANPTTGGWTTFEERSTEVDLRAGEQVARILFEGGSQNIRSVSLTPTGPQNQAPTTTGITGAPEATEGEAFGFDVSDFFADPDAGDALTFSAALPAGLEISSAGVISGTPAADGSFAITVTASDGQASVSSSFTLEVGGAPAGAQAPFPGPDAPVIGADATFVDAGTFDSGGQGVSWNDDPGLNGSQSARADTDVELVGAEQDIGYVEAGEWVEYTVNVAEAGIYDLSVDAKTPIGGNTVTVSIEGGPPLATFALPGSNGGSTAFEGITFAETPAQQVTLAAGEQTIRVAFDGSPADNGYLLDYRGLTLGKVEGAAPIGPIGEAGTLSVAQTDGSAWTSVSFSQALEDASVVVGPLTSNDGSPATVRVRNVTETGFEVQIDEWDYLDGAHGGESLRWVALEAGTHEIDGRTVVAGSGTAAGDDSALSFGTDAFASGPLVFAQVASDQQANAVTAQVNSVSPTGFVLDLDRQEVDQRDLGLAHGTETVDWIAVEGGGHASDGSFSGLKADVTTRGVAVDLPLSGSTDGFVFLAGMQQESGIDTATVRLKGIGDDGWTLFIEEETSRDAELNHALENVGYFGIQGGLIFEDISVA